MFDYTLDGVGYFAASTNQFPTTRKTAAWRAQQIDTSRDPGEQSLNGWWRRSQSSFHLGRGITYMDPGTDPQLSYRFKESAGLDVWTKGQVSLLRDTDTVVSDSATGQLCVGYSVGGIDGVLYAHGSTLTAVTASGATTNLNWGSSSRILALTSDGGAWYVLATDGIYRGALPTGAGVKIYNGSCAAGKLLFAKDRLVACLDASVYTIPATPSTAPADLGPALFTHPSAGWVWSAVAEGPNALYLAGYAGDKSLIYMTTLANSNGNAPTLQVPYSVVEVAKGEVITGLYTHAGNIVLVGTTQGFRFASIQNDGTLTLGNVTLTDAPVYAATGRSNEVWLGGGGNGLYRANLSTTMTIYNAGQSEYLIGSQFWSLQFPYARDLAAHGITATNPSQYPAIRSVTSIGLSGRTAFTVDGIGLVFESSSRYVTSGYLETGRLRFDMTDRKIFAFGRLLNSSSGGGQITGTWIDEAGAEFAACDYDAMAVSEYNFEIDRRKPHSFISLRVTLTAGGSGSSTPVWTEYMVRAMPSGVKQREIQLALMCAHREQPTRGRPEVRSTWERIQQLEALDAANAVFEYKDNNTGEQALVMIAQMQFAAVSVPESKAAKENPEGVLIVTLQTV